MRIRRESENKGTPIIALTASNMPENREKAFASEMDFFLGKPFSATDQIKVVNNLISDKVVSADTDTSEVSFPELPGINTLEALAKTQLDPESYREILITFSNTHKDDVSNIHAKLSESDFKSAKFITHTLKGTAGVIGAYELQSAALELEKMLLKEQSDESFTRIKILNEAMDVVLSSISTLS